MRPKTRSPLWVSAVKAEQAMVLVLMFMGMMPLVMLWVMKEMSSESVDAPPWDRKSSK